MDSFYHKFPLILFLGSFVVFYILYGMAGKLFDYKEVKQFSLGRALLTRLLLSAISAVLSTSVGLASYTGWMILVH